MYAGVGAFGLGLVVLLTLLVPQPDRPLTAAERVTRYTDRPVQGGHESDGPRIDTDQALTTAKDAAAGLLKRSGGLEGRISRRLEAAGSELKSSEWLLLHTAIFVGSGLLGLLIGGGSVLTGILFMALGGFGPWLYLGRRRTKRRKAFNASLPEALQLMSGSLAAGLSLAQSVDTIVREGVDPIASEFKRVLIEARLGVTLEDALEGVAARFESRDFEWVVMAIRIQRQVGGNLAELLETVAATMREREYVRRQVNALAAEGKLSAIVLGALPPVFLLYLTLTQREFVMPLFTDPRGWAMLGFGAGWLGVGIFWMSRLIRVEV
jgi:tight adherence protein B